MRNDIDFLQRGTVGGEPVVGRLLEPPAKIVDTGLKGGMEIAVVGKLRGDAVNHAVRCSVGGGPNRQAPVPGCNIERCFAGLHAIDRVADILHGLREILVHIAERLELQLGWVNADRRVPLVQSSGAGVCRKRTAKPGHEQYRIRPGRHRHQYARLQLLKVQLHARAALRRRLGQRGLHPFHKLAQRMTG